MKPIVAPLLLLILLAYAGISAQAQGPAGGPPPGPHGQHHGEKMPEEKIKALKIAFLTNRLSLTPEEAQAFWPVYNEYQDRKMEVHKAQMTLGKTLKTKFEQLSDAEMNKLLDEHIVLKQKETDLEIDYLQRFRKILPVKKIAMLQKAERDFKLEVLNEYKNRCAPTSDK